MKIIAAPNAFKECLSAPDVASAIAQGALNIVNDLEVVCIPLADGGDGTTEALVAARDGSYMEIEVSDPLFRKVSAQYGLIDDGQTAVMEMAAASGLWRLAIEEKNPMRTSTFGTGEMIRDALDRNVETIIIGIGGSATTDAGIGMAQALGYELLDSENQPIEATGEGMNQLKKINSTHLHPRLKQVKIYVACDVNNPMLGPEGAAPVYGPQKGATPEVVKILEDGLANVADCWIRDLNVSVHEYPGSGAAGGLGAGLMAFCGAELRSGFDLIADYAQLDHALEGASLAITGEGKIDGSTQFGKVPVGVARRAKQMNVPAIALAGSISGEVASLYEEGICALFSIVPGPVTLDEALDQAELNIKRTTEQVIRLWLLKN